MTKRVRGEYLPGLPTLTDKQRDGLWAVHGRTVIPNKYGSPYQYEPYISFDKEITVHSQTLGKLVSRGMIIEPVPGHPDNTYKLTNYGADALERNTETTIDEI